MQNLNNKKQNHTSHIASHTLQKGITLIALIITIIVMLILVGVTINVALNGGLFSKAEEAGSKTKISQIQEALTLKKAEKVADNNGKEPSDYGITIENLDMPESLKKEYGSKLKISKNGYLYYDTSVVTNKEEQDLFKAMGIEDHVETSTGTSSNSYTFTIGELAQRGLLLSEDNGPSVMISKEEFFPSTVSEELKNSTFTDLINGMGNVLTYNITCSNSNYSNMFDLEDTSGPPNAFAIYVVEEGTEVTVVFGVNNENAEIINANNYEAYKDLAFTISMAK